MARRFAHISFGILCLTAAYQLGAESATADWDPTGSGVVWGGTHGKYYGSAGDAWQVTTFPDRWNRDAEFDLPISPSEVKFISQPAWNSGSMYVITTSDEAWAKHGPGFKWVVVGPFPGGPVGVESESFGKTKSAYR
jgi:hypothetical protein